MYSSAKYVNHNGTVPELFKYCVKTDFSPYGEEMHEIYKWCDNNCNGDRWTDSVFMDGGFGLMYERLQFHFETNQEAVLFKLRWV